MTTQNWQRISELFEAAAERPAPQRAAFLREVCKDNAALRHEVESLLAHDAAVDAAFLAVPEPPTVFCTAAAPAADEARVGSSIGEYRLLERIASGGMGTVYRARQEKLRRDVAVKVVRPGLSAESALRRLEHEAMFLARMRHPHIAQVFEAGTFADAATGATLPYFVMELIEGAQPITAYCRGTPHQSPGGKPGDDDPHSAPLPFRLSTGVGGSAIPLRERIELFLQVCDAVHHGHQRGLIHRDLKPGNILVDAAGQVKIIDFGVARSTDADITLTTLHTDSGRLIGTLQYMSPEQCSAEVGDLDVRSDVYSLGVVLYELVCDRLPYELGGATVYSAARIVCDQPADIPRQVNPKIPRDLEAILLKCLEKDRTRRYQSAAQLADDIRRHLDGEPVTARRVGPYRRMLRWVTRHAVAASAALCVLMLLITAVLTTLGVYFAGQRPSRMWMSDDGREVQLMTVAGRRTGPSIASSVPESICMLPHFITQGGRRLAMVSLQSTDNGELGPGVYAFDADVGLCPAGVVWRRNIRAADIPPPPAGRHYSPDDFLPADLALADVFPQIAGPELIAIWHHRPYSWAAITIYDFAGRLHYQIWHDGHFSGAQLSWLPASRLLVAGGYYSTHDPWTVNPAVAGGYFALPIVMAIRPQFDAIGTKLIEVPELPAWHDRSLGRDTAAGPRTAPKWYKFVWPLQRSFPICLTGATPRERAFAPSIERDHPAVSVDVQPEDAAIFGGMSWDIDTSGVRMPGRLVVSDDYRQARDAQNLALPTPAHIRLADLDELLADPFGEIAYGTTVDAGAAP